MNKGETSVGRACLNVLVTPLQQQRQQQHDRRTMHNNSMSAPRVDDSHADPFNATAEEGGRGGKMLVRTVGTGSNT